MLQTCLAQDPSKIGNIPRDTSFTIFSAYIKENSKYPFIKIAEARYSSDIAVDYDIVYCSLEKRNLHLDIFRSLNKNGLFPAVILVHGGGWKSGTKAQMHPIAVELAKAGFLAIAVEYRLSPEAEFPAAIQDLKTAVCWTRANSMIYSIDTNKIAVLGCSSGGHLAAMLGVTNNNQKFEKRECFEDYSCAIQAVIDIDGVLDMTDFSESGKDQNPEKPSVGKLWLGSSYEKNPVIWKEASPVNYVNCNSSPFLFLNSSFDRFHAGRDVLIETLNKCSIYSEVHTFPDTPHTFWLFHPWFNAMNKIISDFLNKIFIPIR